MRLTAHSAPRIARAAALSACVVAAFAAASAQADPADDAIKARRGFFTLLGAEIGPLGAMAKGESPYDADAAKRHAANLQALAGYRFGDLFVAGSSNDDKFGDTRALPVIWTDTAGFSEKAGGLVAAIGALQGVAGEGQAALAGGVGALGKSCGACHDTYRAKEF